MKILLLALLINVCFLISFLFDGCFVPNKALYEFRYVRLVEIHKTELGFDLLWKDNIKAYPQFVKDTSGCDLYVGMAFVTLMPK